MRTNCFVGTIASVSALAAILFAAPADAKRGRDGQLNILYWQAASTLNPYLSGGTKDIEAASMVVEPLAHFDEAGNLVPVLVEEIPTIENGGVAADFTSITWRIRNDIVWSDGTPLTAHDGVFSGEYCLHPDAGCNATSAFTDVQSLEAVDDHTLKITFSRAKPFPYGPLVGATAPVIQKAQFEDCVGARSQECTEENFGPIGTGPFVVTEFRANDVVTFAANRNYRDPDKPAFATAVFKGGGDAASAARAVLETGEFHYAWNMQVEPEILEQMVAAGRGIMVTSFGPAVERLIVNLTNDDISLGDDRSLYKDGGNPHPFLSDSRGAESPLAGDRPPDPGRCRIRGCGQAHLQRSAGTRDLRIDRERRVPCPGTSNWPTRLLDEAGWMPGDDGVRQKDGVRLSILYQTSTNSVRQGTQALIKQMWEQIGVETELRNIDAAVFFGGDPASPDTYGKFYADIEMYTNTFNGTDPERYMANWLCSEIPGTREQLARQQHSALLRSGIRCAGCGAGRHRVADGTGGAGTANERHADAAPHHDSAYLARGRFGPFRGFEGCSHELLGLRALERG